MKLNQVTIIGGTDAYFDNFVNLIPKPVLFPKNNAAKVIAEAIQDLGSVTMEQGNSLQPTLLAPLNSRDGLQVFQSA